MNVRILNNAPRSFRFGVIRNGELLFSRDERRRVDFEFLTMSMYHDFSYHRDAYRRATGLMYNK